MNSLRLCSIAGIAAVVATCAFADEHPVVKLRNVVSGDVQFTVRICESGDSLKFWFNDEANQRWNNCKVPVPDVPVIIATSAGERKEGKTGRDGIVALPAIKIEKGDTFRMSMACTTHQCFSIRDQFVGAFAELGKNTLYAETARRSSNGP